MKTVKCAIIDPKTGRVELMAFESVTAAIEAAGLRPMHVDMGLLLPGVAYVVYEFALFVPPAEQHYARIGRTLLAGPAVLHGVSSSGETVDLVRGLLPPVVFYVRRDAIEQDIRAGILNRPEILIDGLAVWSWPEAPPPEIKMAIELRSMLVG